MRASVLSVVVALLACACPPAARPCADSSECALDETCVLAGAGQGTCQKRAPALDAGLEPPDAGDVADAGDAGDVGEDVDAGEPDAGIDDDAGPGARTLRGSITVGGGTMAGGGKTLRGDVAGVEPTSTSSGATHTLERPQ